MEFISIIKNDVPYSDWLFWKFTGEDFNHGSQLVVAENEEALVIDNGVVMNVFSGGKFQLTSGNYPFISDLCARFTGDVKAFSCKIYFVNKAHAMELFWGTDSPIQLRDPVWDMATKIQARGSYTVQVEDAKKFCLKFIENNTGVITKEYVAGQFRSVMMQKVKSLIPAIVRERNQEILGLCECQDEIAGLLTERLQDTLNEYGIRLVNFYVSALDIPEDDPSRIKLEESRSRVAAMRVEAMAMGVDMKDAWSRLQARDIMQTVAANPGAGGVAAAGAGLGMGMAAGGAMGAMSAAMFAPISTSTPQSAPPAPSTASRFAPKSNGGAPDAPSATGGKECPQCHAKVVSGAKFCGECGYKFPVAAFCKSCGATLAPGAKFCGECGEKQ